jgi:glutathione peroxidase
MKIWSYVFLMWLIVSSAWATSIESNTGEKLEISNFKGKVVVVTNIATKCGYTSQLEGLESIYKKYGPAGLIVIGVPSNDFWGQTPEADAEVEKFCKLKYGVTFPLTKKVVVKGQEKHPLIADLINQDNKEEIAWNFEKFILDKEGKVVKRFKSAVRPDAKEMTELIEKLLK